MLKQKWGVKKSHQQMMNLAHILYEIYLKKIKNSRVWMMHLTY